MLSSIRAVRDGALVGDPDSTPTLVTDRVEVLDLDLAARCSDHLVALERGRVVAAGPPCATTGAPR